MAHKSFVSDCERLGIDGAFALFRDFDYRRKWLILFDLRGMREMTRAQKTQYRTLGAWRA